MRYQPRPVMAPNGHPDSSVKLEGEPLRVRSWRAFGNVVEIKHTRELSAGDSDQRALAAAVHAYVTALSGGSGHGTESVTDVNRAPGMNKNQSSGSTKNQ